MQTSIEALYDQYKDIDLIKRCEKYALWTLPALFPKDWVRKGNTSGNIEVEHDYQSVGALLVNSAAPKITSLLFPVRQPFFRIKPTDDTVSMFKELASEEGKEWDDAATQAMSSDIEREACEQVFKNAAFAQLQQLTAYLLITGNALLVRKDEKMLVYSLHNYVVKRDGSGTVMCIILREFLAFGSLNPAIQRAVDTQGKYKPEDEVTLFTKVVRVTNGTKTKYRVTQEIDGKDLGTSAEYPEKLCPYVPVYWKLVNGDSYGRGQVEEFAGDFAKLSDLSKALTLYELEACTIINLVKPGATTDLEALNNATIGRYVQGNPADISKHESGEYQKIRQISDSLVGIFQRLAPVFMYKANVRDAERVTKEEIRQGAEEVDSLMGGVYSNISTQVHEPLAYLCTKEVRPELEAKLSQQGFKFSVLVGLAALGRSAELNLLTQAAQVVSAIVPALKATSPRFDPDRVIDTVFSSFGLNIADYTYTAEELKKQQQDNSAAMQTLNPMDAVSAVEGVIQ